MVHLNKLPLFRDLSQEGKEMLNRGVLSKQIASATPILHKGSPVSGAYVVTRGRLRVFSIAPSGTEATLYAINPGETCVLALNCLFQDLLYPAWVASEAPTEVAVIPGPVYRRLFEREPSIQNLTIQALSTAVFRLMHQLEQVHFHKLEHRLADFILCRASSNGILHITQQEMASHLGTTREVVARILRALAARDYIETKRGMTHIRNSAAMAELITRDGDLSG
jgi:CRP/FNR family transcriptional regulator, anaerobic regulatory protein